MFWRNARLISTVQPRACGERWIANWSAKLRHGSAPRVRGTELPNRRPCTRTRFSPARAGNGSPGPINLRNRSVQPRACGERLIEPQASRFVRGSAPRVRGTDVQHFKPARRRRFSPARAGNGFAGLNFAAHSSVQPRACGERLDVSWSMLRNFGSAPRVRGTAWPMVAYTQARRFSPARAGNGFSCAF